MEEASRRRIDQRDYVYWAFTEDPSRIPQIVFRTLAKHDPRQSAQVHFTMPRSANKGHVFRVFIHIDKVEDLLFYHYPWEELIADGRVQWRDFYWQHGQADGELDEEELHPPEDNCRLDRQRFWHYRDDDDENDHGHKRSKGRGFMGRVSNWIDSKGKGRDRNTERDHGNGWYRGETSQGRTRSRQMGNTEPRYTRQHQLMDENLTCTRRCFSMVASEPNSDAILIIPNDQFRHDHPAIIHASSGAGLAMWQIASQPDKQLLVSHATYGSSEPAEVHEINLDAHAQGADHHLHSPPRGVIKAGVQQSENQQSEQQAK